MFHTLRLEFGIPEFMDLSKEEILLDQTISGYDIDDIMIKFSELNFPSTCITVAGRGCTMGTYRVAHSVTPALIARLAESENKVVYYDRTDHDMARDYFVRAILTTRTREEIIRDFTELEKPVCGKLVSTWWRFGRATHAHDHLIIQDGNYWYHMFGKFYWNTGKRK